MAKISESEQKKEDWMNSKWRPAMGWMYMIVCITDFVLFPILWSLVPELGKGQVNVQWQPITLQGAGLFHIAMGAVLGLAAYGRTQEKLGGANNGGIQLPGNVGTTYIPPNATTNANINLGNNNTTQTSNNWGSSNSFAGTANFNQPVYGQVVSGFGGKKAPVPADEPLL